MRRFSGVKHAVPPKMAKRRGGWRCARALCERRHLLTTRAGGPPGTPPRAPDGVLNSPLPKPGKTGETVSGLELDPTAQALSSWDKSQSLIPEPPQPALSLPGLCSWLPPTHNRSATWSTETRESLTSEITKFELSHFCLLWKVRRMLDLRESPLAPFPSGVLKLPPMSLPTHLAETFLQSPFK